MPGYPELLVDFRVAMVVPQQSLRRSIKNVFRKTPGLSPKQVLSPFEVGSAARAVRPAHRGRGPPAQPAGGAGGRTLNKMFVDINENLFGQDDPSSPSWTGLTAQSQHQIYLLDGAQAVRPADLPVDDDACARRDVQRRGRNYPLTSQMRVQAGDDYVGYVRGVLDGSVTDTPASSAGTTCASSTIPAGCAMRSCARERETVLPDCSRASPGLGGASTIPDALDIRVDGLQLRWNTSDIDWVNSPTSVDEVGSIHTIQGYDLNYAGVIIGKDLRYDPVGDRIYFDRTQLLRPQWHHEQPNARRLIHGRRHPAVRPQHLRRTAHPRDARNVRLRLRRPTTGSSAPPVVIRSARRWLAEWGAQPTALHL